MTSSSTPIGPAAVRRGREGAGLRRLLGWPVRRLLDRRVEWAISLLDDRLGRPQRLNTIHGRFDALEEWDRRILQALGGERAAGGGALRSLAELDAATAAFLNWAAGPEGYAAQANLWFNQSVPVEHHRGAVRPLMVNERVVEAPFVFSNLPALTRMCILDVGGAESTVALSLASLGHDTWVIDPRGYPLEHPNLTVVTTPLDELHDTPPFDAAICLSAVEHFGLGHYGVQSSATDRDAVGQLRELLAPGGLLLLTVPFATTASVDAFQRVYDQPALDRLLGGWQTESQTVFWRTGLTTWTTEAPDSHDRQTAVALVRARNGA